MQPGWRRILIIFMCGPCFGSRLFRPCVYDDDVKALLGGGGAASRYAKLEQEAAASNDAFIQDQGQKQEVRLTFVYICMYVLHVYVYMCVCYTAKQGRTADVELNVIF